MAREVEVLSLLCLTFGPAFRFACWEKCIQDIFSSGIYATLLLVIILTRCLP